MNELGPSTRSLRRRRRLSTRRRPSFAELVGPETAEKYRQDMQAQRDQELANLQKTRQLGSAGLIDFVV